MSLLIKSIQMKVNIFINDKQLQKEKSLKPIMTKPNRLIGIKGNIPDLNATVTCSVAYLIQTKGEYKLLVKHATKSLDHHPRYEGWMSFDLQGHARWYLSSLICRPVKSVEHTTFRGIDYYFPILR